MMVKSNSKITLLLAIRSLNIGGAERQFIELVKNIDKRKFNIFVCTMYGGVFENELKNIKGIEYVNLNKRGRFDIGFYFKYKNYLHSIRPDVIYSWLGEMNLFSYWCKPENAKLIWGIRASNMDLKKYGKVSQILFWLQKKYSKKVDKIIANSYAAIEFHKKEEFFMNNAVVVHNGIDTERFKKDTKYRKAFRDKYQLTDNDIAIGMVARIDHMKGYEIFAKSAKSILDKYENVIFFAVGDGNIGIKKKCEEILGKYNNTRFLWLGKVKEVEKVYSGLDISSSSSFGEGFSNSIAEAMACELPCVVTDVGDSKIIVGDTGIVVRPNSVEEFTNGLEKMINNDFKSLGKKARKRIEENFAIEKMVRNTEKVILEVYNEK